MATSSSSQPEAATIQDPDDFVDLAAAVAATVAAKGPAKDPEGPKVAKDAKGLEGPGDPEGPKGLEGPNSLKNTEGTEGTAAHLAAAVATTVAAQDPKVAKGLKDPIGTTEGTKGTGGPKVAKGFEDPNSLKSTEGTEGTAAHLAAAVATTVGLEDPKDPIGTTEGPKGLEEAKVAKDPNNLKSTEGTEDTAAHLAAAVAATVAAQGPKDPISTTKNPNSTEDLKDLKDPIGTTEGLELAAAVAASLAAKDSEAASLAPDDASKRNNDDSIVAAAVAAVVAATTSAEKTEEKVIFKGSLEQVLTKLCDLNIITKEFKTQLESILQNKPDQSSYETILPEATEAAEAAEATEATYNINDLALQFDQLRDLPIPMVDPKNNMTTQMNIEISNIKNAITSLNNGSFPPNYKATFQSIQELSQYNEFNEIKEDTLITKKYIHSAGFESYKNFIVALENINAITGLGTLDFTDRLAKLDMIDCTCRYDIAESINSALFYQNEFKDIVDFM